MITNKYRMKCLAWVKFFCHPIRMSYQVGPPGRALPDAPAPADGQGLQVPQAPLPMLPRHPCQQVRNCHTVVHNISCN